MIPFICPTCGRVDIDSPDCTSCAAIANGDAAAA